MTVVSSEPRLVSAEKIRVQGPLDQGFEEILTHDALGFVANLTNQFSGRLSSLLEWRSLLAARIRAGTLPDFLHETEHVREASWKVAPIPSDLRRRRVEITGPVERKMMINAFNSGADVFMADFEDSHSPTWKGTVQGQVNLRDAVNRRLEYVSPDGKKYQLRDEVATLFVRPRGLHLIEKHVLVDSKPVPAALFDFGLYAFQNAKPLLEQGTGPYFYLAKLENHQEARLWNDIFEMAEVELGLSPGSMKCSVLIENVLAAFEMDEILYELRDRITALNFGRWDYIFSFIKKLGNDPGFVLPERSALTMSAPFLRACSRLLVQTCRKRGASPIGGMVAQVPIRNNPGAQAEAVKKVVSDKQREASEGFEGAWAAHPDLVPVVMEVFENARDLNLKEREEEAGPTVTAKDLLAVPLGAITEGGLRSNIDVSLRYLESWLRGLGCVAIYNLMEDTATVEICRAQLWQWVHQRSRLSDGRTITEELFLELLKANLLKIRSESGEQNYMASRFELAADILNRLVTNNQFTEFLTLLAYSHL